MCAPGAGAAVEGDDRQYPAVLEVTRVVGVDEGDATHMVSGGAAVLPPPDRMTLLVPAYAVATAGLGAGHRWLSTLTIRPLGSLTKNRRTPHSSSCKGCTISAPLARMTS